MNIAGWEISLIIAVMTFVITFASTFGAMKSKATAADIKDKEQDKNFVILNKFMNENVPLLRHLSKAENAIVDKQEEQSKDIVSLKQKIAHSPTMKEVRDEFLTKEIFIQFEKHIDTRFDHFEKKFDTIADGQEKILQAVNRTLG